MVVGYVRWDMSSREFMDSGCLSVVFATDPAQIDEHVRCALVVPCSAAWKRLCMHTEKPMERIEKRFSCDGSGVQQFYLGGRM
eukprot:scaffold7357_cov67-Skeletonema_marinoi.AAC.1